MYSVRQTFYYHVKTGTQSSLRQVNLQMFRDSVQMLTKTNPSFWFKISNNPVGKSCLEGFTVFHIFILFTNTLKIAAFAFS